MVVTTLEFLGLAVARKCAWNQEEKAKCDIRQPDEQQNCMTNFVEPKREELEHYEKTKKTLNRLIEAEWKKVKEAAPAAGGKRKSRKNRKTKRNRKSRKH
jgi:hypothetical protein